MRTINLDALIPPISDENPTGPNSRDDISPESKYYIIKDARAQARNIERKQSQGDTDADPSKQWQTVLKDSQALLSKESKDLEAACWLTEALIRKHGFAGILDGFSLIESLIQDYWDTLHPMPDEDGMETRLASLFGLMGGESEGSLISQIRYLPITDDVASGPYALWEYRQSLDTNAIQDEEAKNKRYNQGIATLDSVQQTANESGTAFYQTLNQKIDQCRDTYKRIDNLLTEKCPDIALPSALFLMNVLEEFQDHIRFITADAPFSLSSDEAETIEASETADKDTTTETLSDTASSNTQAAITSQPTAVNLNVAEQQVQSRQQAYDSIQKVAAFLKKTEPHSPISYLLEKAVRWGKLPLPELLNEMISDDVARNNACNLTGIPKNSEF